MNEKTSIRVKEFLNYLKLEKGLSEATITSYRVDLKEFFKYTDLDFKDVEKEDIYGYVEEMKKKFKNNTVQRKVSSLKSFYKFLYVNKYISKDPSNTVKSVKKQRRLPEILHEDEFKKILETFDHNPKSVRDALMLKLLMATGARISEIVNLEIKDIADNEYKYIRVLGKGSKYRFIPIYESIGEEIKGYVTTVRELIITSEKDHRVFPKTNRSKFYTTFREHAERAGIKKRVHPHMIRHSIATLLLKNGADIRVVQELLGHASITTTELYTHVEKSKLKSIYDRIGIGDEDEE